MVKKRYIWEKFSQNLKLIFNVREALTLNIVRGTRDLEMESTASRVHSVATSFINCNATITKAYLKIENWEFLKVRTGNLRQLANKRIDYHSLGNIFSRENLPILMFCDHLWGINRPRNAEIWLLSIFKQSMQCLESEIVIGALRFLKITLSYPRNPA